MRTYRDIQATQIYAYPGNSLPGTYARNSPDNPDAVVSYTAPQPSVHASRQETDTGEGLSPNYSFDLMLKRTDSETVFATLKGKKYESDAAWDALDACATR